MSRGTVLIVEDEAMIAMMIEEYLDALDFTLFATASGVEDALAALTGEKVPHLALLDCRLGSERSWPVAAQLRELGIPFAFMTGAPDDIFPEEFSHMPRLGKPFTLASMEDALNRALDEFTVFVVAMNPVSHRGMTR